MWTLLGFPDRKAWCNRQFVCTVHAINTILISTSFSRISVGENLLEKLRIMSFAHIRMAPETNDKHTKKTKRRIDNLLTYLTLPIRLTLPEGSRSNSEKFTAIHYVNQSTSFVYCTTSQSVAETCPRSSRNFSISGGTLKGQGSKFFGWTEGETHI